MGDGSGARCGWTLATPTGRVSQSLEELKRRYPITANLAVMSLLLGTLIAIPVGVLSAVRQDTLADYAARCLSSLACPCPISGSPFSSF